MSDSISNQSNWIDEYHNGVRYGLDCKILVDEQSVHQRITIIESSRYGKGLLLDGCWMTTEKQEKTYHECLVHPALCSAVKINKILIIGGGDGGTARECLLYKDVKQVDMIEIDEKVVELSKKYLPSIGDNAWKDPRLNVIIENGIHWVFKCNDDSYDVIIIDGSDPKGPAKGLFNKKFFEECKRVLKPKGILASQSESPESFSEVHIDMIKLMRQIFDFADPLYGWVPIYPSGWWSWLFASDKTAYYLTPNKVRAEKISNTCEIWSTKWQEGAFKTMPAFIERRLSL